MGEDEIDDVIRFGRLLFGADWIDSLTPRECWLINTYGHLLEDVSYPIAPVAGQYMGSIGSALRSEVEAAVDRHAWMSTQWDEALAAFKANKNNPGRVRKSCSLAEYKKHWDYTIQMIGAHPSDPEDDSWAKRSGFSVESVRTRRRQFITSLPEGQRSAIQKGGRRKLMSKS